MDDLTAFLAQYAHPYDPATDTYRRPPFAQPVKAGKSSPIYNAHSYHTKVPPEGIIPYLEHYTDPGDLVLDPFCGSGMSGVASLISGRSVVLNDLSPAAVHIARNYTTPIDITALQSNFDRIKQVIQDEFDWLYGTTCERCKGKAEIQYTVWSDVFECGRCGKDIILWEVAVDQEQKKIREVFTCPSCGREQKKMGLKRLPSVPVLISYECERCQPSRSEHQILPSDLKLLDEIQNREIPYWIPSVAFDLSGPQYRRSALSNRSITQIGDLFTKRNLWAFSCLWQECSKIQDKVISSRLCFVLTAIMGVASRRNRWPQQQTMSGTIYIPSLSVEMNIARQFQRRGLAVIDVAKLSSQLFATFGAQVLRSSATHLDLPDNVIDYVFTDPPFGSSIYYSEMNFLWESWLGELTEIANEAVVHRKTDGGSKRIQDYALLMEESFREMYRVLKPGRWASVVFHNSDDQIWQAILEAASKTGFEVAEINAFDKVQLTFKGLKGYKGEERVTNKDIVLNLRKPQPQDLINTNDQTRLVEVELQLIETIADFISTSPPPENRTLQYLWNHLLYDMLRDGSVQVGMAGLEEMLAFHYQTFKIVDGRYYLRGEAVVGGNVFDLASDAGALAWLGLVLSNQPQTTGDLIPKWQQETAALGGADTGRLDRLLEQNFWQEKKTGRWRLPTSTERERMSARADLSAQAHLRVVRRYLVGELERRPDDRELAAWIRFCYSREFWPEAAALFQQINPERLEADEYKTVKKMAQVARLKSK